VSEFAVVSVSASMSSGDILTVQSRRRRSAYQPLSRGN